MIKKCIQCGNEYESTQKAGQEQKYCSKSCRNKAANERRENNMAEKFKREIQQATTIGNEKREVPEQVTAIRQSGFGIPDIKIFELVTENANLTAENKRLQDKVQALEVEKGQLIAEVEGLESEMEGDDSDGGMLSGIMNNPTTQPLVAVAIGKFVDWLTTQPTNNTQQNKENAKAKVA